MNIHFCHELPIQATYSECYVNRRLYRVTTHDAKPVNGIYRQVSREGRTGLRSAEDNVVAVSGDKLIELSRDAEVEEELREALGNDRHLRMR